ncbi:MAG: hypothetical protein QM831_09930 [Kofleriaceae bacterium]
MRPVIALLVLCNCGRVGFDALDDGGHVIGGDDDASMGSGSGSQANPVTANNCVSPGYGDDFMEVFPCNAFGSPLVQNGSLNVNNGTMTLTPNANNNVVIGCQRTGAVFGNPGAFVEVSQILVAGQTRLGLSDANSHVYAIGVQSNAIAFADDAGTMGTRAYDATGDRWWRIRPVGATVIAETSPDGKTWTLLATSSVAVASTATIAASVIIDNSPMPGTATFEGIRRLPSVIAEGSTASTNNGRKRRCLRPRSLSIC